MRVDGADRLWVATQPSADAPACHHREASDLRVRAVQRDRRRRPPRSPHAGPAGRSGRKGPDDRRGRGPSPIVWEERRTPPLRPHDRRVPLAWTAIPSERGSLAGRVIRDMAVGPSGGIWDITLLRGRERSGGASCSRGPRPAHGTQVMMRERVAGPGRAASPDRLAIDRSGVLSVGSNGGGVRSRGRELRQHLPLTRVGLPGLSAFRRAVCPGRDGAVWVGSPRGLEPMEPRRPGPYRRSSPAAPLSGPTRTSRRLARIARGTSRSAPAVAWSCSSRKPARRASMGMTAPIRAAWPTTGSRSCAGPGRERLDRDAPRPGASSMPRAVSRRLLLRSSRPGDPSQR